MPFARNVLLASAVAAQCLVAALAGAPARADTMHERRKRGGRRLLLSRCAIQARRKYRSDRRSRHPRRHLDIPRQRGRQPADGDSERRGDTVGCLEKSDP